MCSSTKIGRKHTTSVKSVSSRRTPRDGFFALTFFFEFFFCALFCLYRSLFVPLCSLFNIYIMFSFFRRGICVCVCIFFRSSYGYGSMIPLALHHRSPEWKIVRNMLRMFICVCVCVLMVMHVWVRFLQRRSTHTYNTKYYWWGRICYNCIGMRAITYVCMTFTRNIEEEETHTKNKNNKQHRTYFLRISVSLRELLIQLHHTAMVLMAVYACG